MRIEKSLLFPLIDRMETYIKKNSYWHKNEEKYIYNEKGRIVWIIYSSIVEPIIKRGYEGTILLREHRKRFIEAVNFLNEENK